MVSIDNVTVLDMETPESLLIQHERFNRLSREGKILLLILTHDTITTFTELKLILREMGWTFKTIDLTLKELRSFL